MSAEDVAMIEEMLHNKALRTEDPNRVVELGIAAWLDAVVVVLNAMWHMPQAPSVPERCP